MKSLVDMYVTGLTAIATLTIVGLLLLSPILVATMYSEARWLFAYLPLAPLVLGVALRQENIWPL